jgi:hypothetical protein
MFKYSVFVKNLKYDLHLQDKFNYRRRNYKAFEEEWKNWIVINYHFIGLLKKWIIVFLIFLSDSFPKTACSLLLVVFVLQALLCGYFRPFLFKLVGATKFFGDILDIVMVSLMLRVHVLFESTEDMIDSEKVEVYKSIIIFGKTQVILLIIIHVIHFTFISQTLYFWYHKWD